MSQLPIKIHLPDGFLDEEIRNGYTISHEMKEIWAVELDLLVEFDKVCKENGLKYFASCGTKLGAVRHHGFIPWDDDVDVMMMRDEFDKLCKIAPQLFTYPYFFQTEETDKGSARGHAQLRNSKTTAILKSEASMCYKYNQGIFLDIFPLDNIPDDEKLFEEQRVLGNKTHRKFLMYVNKYHPEKPTLRDRLIVLRNQTMHFLNKDRYLKYYYEYENICRKYNNSETKYVAMLNLGFNNRAYRLKKDFEESIDMDFEFIKLPVPKNYEDALTRVYGDWRKIVVGENDHGEVIFSATEPYTEYFKGKHSR